MKRLIPLIILSAAISCDILGETDAGVERPHDIRSVAQARMFVNCTGLWVEGYIVGGNLSSKSIRFEGPFTANTNLAIASYAECRERDSCLAVQLPKGAIRDELNLVDNPGNLGRRIILKGNVVSSYFGLVGIKDMGIYHFPDESEAGYDDLP